MWVLAGASGSGISRSRHSVFGWGHTGHDVAPETVSKNKPSSEAGYRNELGKVFYAKDLAQGENIIFCATGISDNSLLRGVRVRGHTAITHSVLMRAPQPDSTND